MIPTVPAVDDDRHLLAFVARRDCQAIIAEARAKGITLAENVGVLDFATTHNNVLGTETMSWDASAASRYTSNVRLTNPCSPSPSLREVVAVLMSAAIQKEEPDDGDDERIDE